MNVDHRLWPGKGHPLPDAEHTWHPATFHCLDVMACAIGLMEAAPARMQRLATLYSIPQATLERTFAFLIAMHDIGKLSAKFCSDIGHSLPVGAGNGRRTHLRHWEISYLLLIGKLDEAVEAAIGCSDEFARDRLYIAVSGHHGQPPSDTDEFSFADTVGVEAALAFVGDIRQLLSDAPPLNIKQTEAAKLSWTLAGLTVVADWLGSNQHWFPYTAPSVSMDNYWASARERAANAIKRSGLYGSIRSSEPGIRSLFDIREPRPMQIAVADCQIPEGPSLAIIEDATGSGKTEAAIVLAQRFMAMGKGEGIYVALPTMATANAMFDRLGTSYRRLFDEGEQPSLALAHGHRGMNPLHGQRSRTC